MSDLSNDKNRLDRRKRAETAWLASEGDRAARRAEAQAALGEKVGTHGGI